ncbi:unnamed protein product [Menidia menidia]|uniref:(Atlantic silverside) hypothetical protein n=1 Tax=Menidia menidia TaxID=238744 RepID=A0A8S4BVJ6_9TELE|nr:unnamed protein product [Menidia menidia]
MRGNSDEWGEGDHPAAGDGSAKRSDHDDVLELKESLVLYEKASSAKVSWGKSNAFFVSNWHTGDIQQWHGSSGWGWNRIKILQKVMTFSDRIAKVCRIKWNLSCLNGNGLYLSCPAEKLTNNLVTSFLWHRLVMMIPPDGLLADIQRLIVDFFWSGHHWLLYCSYLRQKGDKD